MLLSRVLLAFAVAVPCASACNRFERPRPEGPQSERPPGGRASETPGPRPQPQPQPREVFVDVATFVRAIEAGASVLDARDVQAYSQGHVPGAVSAPWQAFVDGDNSGLVSDDLPRLTRQLARAGVDVERPVMVYGQWNGAWGEEGRLFWLLEYLGHSRVRVLAGGVGAYVAAGYALDTKAPAVAPGNFVAAPRPELRATTAEVRDALERGDAVILDIRTREEFQGLTPHGSARGGHIPSARHFHWKNVFDASGALLSPAALRARLGELGISNDTQVIAYCTGGIRSGFVYAVMRWAGYGRPRNYDGSFWEWAGAPELPVAR